VRLQRVPLIEPKCVCAFIGCKRKVPRSHQFCYQHLNFASDEVKEVFRKAREQLDIQKKLVELGYCYVYAVGYGERVKFGRTSNLLDRMLSYRCHSAVDLELVAAIISEFDLETLIHRHLMSDRLYGEWFIRSEAANRIIGLMDKEDDIPIRKFLAS
jgi:hypothetical protein